MNVAICEDNAVESNLLHYLVKEYFSSNSVSCSVALYDRGMPLYCDIMEGESYDILFLDLFMGDSFGMNIAEKLRDELSYRGKIVFCTASAAYALDSYRVCAAGYIVKPFSYDDICRTLDFYRAEYQKDCFLIKKKSEILYIPFQEILYVESDNSKCILHRTRDREYSVYRKLGDIETELQSPCFLRCHQSYLVNMDHIKEAQDTFILKNGDEVLIRKKSKSEILKRFFAYKEHMQYMLPQTMQF